MFRKKNILMDPSDVLLCPPRLNRTASPIQLMKFSPDGEFFATAGQVGGLWCPFMCIKMFLFLSKDLTEKRILTTAM